MQSLFKGIFLLAFLALARCTPTVPQKCEQRTIDEARKAERALANFAVNLLKNVSNEQQHRDKNQVVSPLSIALTLVELENGANGQTRNELRQQLVENGASEEVLSIYSALEKNVQTNQPKTRLQVANGIFRSQKLQLKQEYEQSTKQCLETQHEQADFQNKLDEARRRINQVMSDKTSRRIPELLKQGSLKQDEKVVLASAMYFKGAFRQPFNKQQTAQGPFYRRGQTNNPQQVQYMKAQMEVRQSQDSKLQAVELRYDQAEISMYVLLPKQRDGINQLERELTGDRLRSIIQGMSQQKVQIQMPKFALRTSLDLKSALTRMGVRSVFGKQADLSRMTEQQVSVTNAVHEAYIQIDENGTEAAAAEGLGAETIGTMAEPVQFTADHPFIYAVVHNRTGAVVYIGKVVEVENANQ